MTMTSKEDVNKVLPDDILVILHRNEAQILIDMIYEGLESSSYNKDQKRVMLHILKHIKQ